MSDDKDREPTESGGDERAQLLARVAWLYHIEGLTQQQIARELGLHRLKVMRLLARARQDGIVQVSIHSPHLGCLELEKALTGRFGLKQAMVVPSPLDPAATQDVIGAAVGHFLNRRLQPRMSLGLVSGRTLYGALSVLEPRALPGLEVVSVLGGLTRRAAMLPYELTHRLAHLYGATCYYMPAPSYAESRSARDEFLGQALVREIMRRAQAVDVAVLGVGRLTSRGVIRSYDLVDEEEVASLIAAGAVGSLLGRFIDATGRLVDHPMNERVVGLSHEKLAQVPEVVLCGGGEDKAVAMAAVLTGGLADIVVTDEAAARAILERAAPR